MARSARLTSTSWVSPARRIATPALKLTNTRWSSCTSARWARARCTRVTAAAASKMVQSGISSRNSSPPKRAIASLPRKVVRATSTTWRSAASPPGWP